MHTHHIINLCFKLSTTLGQEQKSDSTLLQELPCNMIRMLQILKHQTSINTIIKSQGQTSTIDKNLYIYSSQSDLQEVFSFIVLCQKLISIHGVLSVYHLQGKQRKQSR